MPEIRILPPDVVRLIAAGEVIERPAAVVKELVENALDAGATEIYVDVHDGGLSWLRVADNGCGIPSDQVALAFQRHATNKIASAADLGAVRTLGFRGEALASIATVAEVSLVTQTHTAPFGVAVRVRNGNLCEQCPTARHPGTTVTVRHLFRDIPARLKFVRDQRTEEREILMVIRRYLLAHPAIRFQLRVDGRPVLGSEGTGRLEDAVAAVYGPGPAGLMTRLEATGTVTLQGLISVPGLARADRRHLHLVVNSRPVMAHRLLDALENAYRPFFPRGRHPLAIIQLDLAPELVDVNVHPAKLDVRLRDESAVCQILMQAVRTALASSHARADASVDFTPSALITPRHAVAEDGQLYPGQSAACASLTLVGVTGEGLIVAQGEDGLYLVDPHRAHERAIFDQLRAQQRAGAVARRELIDPIILELRPHQATLLEPRLAELEEVGFVCERFGGRSFLVRSVPAAAQELWLAEVFAEALEDETEDWLDRLLVSLSCRSAVRKGRVLPPEEQAALLEALAQTATPGVCPHGSPVLLHLPRTYLQRQFGW